MTDGGRRYLPLPGARLVRTGPAGSPVDFVAAPRTPVHAVADGVVTGLARMTDTSDSHRAAVTVLGADGLVYRYEGLDGASVDTTEGEHVEAGWILGVIPDGEPRRSSLTIVVEGGPNEIADAYELLVGLSDPAELGYQAPRPHAPTAISVAAGIRGPGVSHDPLATLLAPAVGRQHPGQGTP